MSPPYTCLPVYAPQQVSADYHSTHHVVKVTHKGLEVLLTTTPLTLVFAVVAIAIAGLRQVGSHGLIVNLLLDLLRWE